MQRSQEKSPDFRKQIMELLSGPFVAFYASVLPVSDQHFSPATEQAAKLELIGNATLMALVMTTLLAVATAWVLWSPARSELVVGWCSLVALVQLVRLYTWRGYRRAARNAKIFEPQCWMRRLRATLLATGTLWGVAGMLLMPPVPGLEQTFVTTVILGICASATSWLAVERTGFLFLIVPALSGLVLGYLRMGGEIAWLIAPLITLFGVFMVSNGKRARDQFRALRNLGTQLSADREQILRLSRVASQAAHGVAVVDLDGRVAWVNEEFSRMFGYSVEQLRSRSLVRCVVGRATNLASVEKFAAAFRNGETRREDLQLKSRSGQYIWGRVQISPIQDENGKIVEFLCAVADISTELNVRMALEDHLEALRALANLASDPELDADALVERVLELGYSVMGLESAMVVRIRDRKLEVELASGTGATKLSPGSRAMLVGTLAEKVLDVEDTLMVEDVQRMDQGPRCLFDGVQCGAYIGHPLHLPDHSTLVVSLAGSRPMQRAMSKRNRVFLAICFQYISSILERRAQSVELHKLVEQVPGMVYQFQLMPDGTMRFPFSSSGIRDIYGLEDTEARKSAEKAFEKLHPSDREAVRASIMQSATDLSIWDDEYRVVDSDGEIRWVHGTSAPEALLDGSVLWHGYIRDVSERKRAAITLEQNERRLRALFELTPMGIVLNDIKSGAFVDTNERFQALTGFDEQELTEKRFADLCPSEFFERDRQYVSDLLRGGDSIPYERPMLCADGTSFIARMHSTVLQDGPESSLIWTLIEDVTESRELEEELRTLNHELEERVAARTRDVRRESIRTALIIDVARDGFILHDDEGRIHRVNPALCAMLGVEVGDLIGKSITDIASDTEPEQLRRGIEKVRREGSAIFETRFAHADGTELELEVTVASGDSEEQAWFYAFVRDIGVRKMAEKALRRAKREAEQASNAKSEFLSHMSHELRTPLNAILGFSQLLETDPELKENSEQSDNVAEIRKAGEHLLQQVNEILDLSKIEHGRICLDTEAMPLAPVISECVSMMRTFASERHVALHIEIDDDLKVYCDRSRLRQVVLNLLSNAVKYNKEPGSVWIQAEQNESGVQLAFVDTGRGIGEDAQKRLFEPFERLDAVSMDIEGTGIGLALSKKLIEAMGGKIGVKSSPGKGSTFWVTLPGVEKLRDQPEGESDSVSQPNDEIKTQGSLAP